LYTKGKSEIIGQKSSQSLKVKIMEIDADGEKVGSLVDALSAVNGIIISSIVFDIFDKSSL
jgi:hypothetical protein